MKKKSLILVLIVLAVAGFLMWRGGGAQKINESAVTNTGATSASFGVSTPPRFSFGDVSMAKGLVEHDFEVKNDTPSALTVVSAETSCMCTETVLDFPGGKEFGPFGMPGHGFMPQINEPVAPGDTVKVKAVFNPAAHGPSGIGFVEREIVLNTNNGRYHFGFDATVTP
jgi:hypothetical protein